jgi:hypothetical protein
VSRGVRTQEITVIVDGDVYTLSATKERNFAADTQGWRVQTNRMRAGSLSATIDTGGSISTAFGLALSTIVNRHFHGFPYQDDGLGTYYRLFNRDGVAWEVRELDGNRLIATYRDPDSAAGAALALEGIREGDARKAVVATSKVSE